MYKQCIALGKIWTYIFFLFKYQKYYKCTSFTLLLYHIIFCIVRRIFYRYPVSYWFLLNLYMPFAKYFISELMFPLGTDVFWNNSKLCKAILERYNFTASARNFLDFSVLKVLFFIPYCRFNFKYSISEVSFNNLFLTSLNR